MFYWQLELHRTVLNGPGAHDTQGVAGSSPARPTKFFLEITDD